MPRTIKQLPLVEGRGDLLEIPEGARVFLVGFVDASDTCQMRIEQDFVNTIPFEIKRAIYETVQRILLANESQA